MLAGWPLTVAAAGLTGTAAGLAFTGYHGAGLAWLGGGALSLLWIGYALAGGETPR